MAVGVVAAVLVAGGVTAIPWLTAPPPTVLERERPGIEAAMERYRIGYRNRDLDVVAAVFPALPENLRQAMQRTFTNCLVYEVIFDDLEVRLAPDSESLAGVTLRSTHVCTPQTGGPQTTATRSEAFSLRKSGESWVIAGVKSLAN